MTLEYDDVIFTKLDEQWTDYWARFKPFSFTHPDGYTYHCFFLHNDILWHESIWNKSHIKKPSLCVYRTGNGILTPEKFGILTVNYDMFLTKIDGVYRIDDEKVRFYIKQSQNDKNYGTGYYPDGDPLWHYFIAQNRELISRTDDNIVHNFLFFTKSSFLNFLIESFVSLNDNKHIFIRNRLHIEDMNAVIANDIRDYFLKHSDINWRYSCIISKESKYLSNYNFPIVDDDKYDLFTTGPKLQVNDKNGTTRIIEPRKDFLITYPLVAQTNTLSDLKQIMQRVDSLERVTTCNEATTILPTTISNLDLRPFVASKIASPT